MFGTVSKYDRFKGIGFIVPDDQTLPDFFVCPRLMDCIKHQRFLIVGQRVEFEPANVDTQPEARHVRKLPMTIARQTSGDVDGNVMAPSVSPHDSLTSPKRAERPPNPTVMPKPRSLPAPSEPEEKP